MRLIKRYFSCKLKGFKNRNLESWASRDGIGRIYFLAAYLLLFPVISFFVSPYNVQRIAILAMPAMLLFGFGFVAFAVPSLLRIFSSRYGVWPFVWLQAVLFPVCLGLSRGLVAASLGLPPQSFELTVTLLALLMVPLAWIFLLSLASLFAVSVGMIVGALGGLFAQFITAFYNFREMKTKNVVGIRRGINSTVEHAMGYMATLTLVLGLSASYEGTLRRPDLVRLIAYGMDFNRVSNYPGIRHDRPARLLDNGKVAYAIRDGRKISIIVESLP